MKIRTSDNPARTEATQRNGQNGARQPPDQAPEEKGDHHRQRKETHLASDDERREDIPLEELENHVDEENRARLPSSILEVGDGDGAARQASMSCRPGEV